MQRVTGHHDLELGYIRFVEVDPSYNQNGGSLMVQQVWPVKYQPEVRLLPPILLELPF